MTIRSSNEAFLEIYEAIPLTNVGWEIKVYSLDDFEELLDVLTQWRSFKFLKTVNDPGSWTINFDAREPKLQSELTQSVLFESENLIRFEKDGVRRFAGLNEDETRERVADNEGRNIEVGGRGAAALFEWATILPPGWPYHHSLQWVWVNSPGMLAWLEVKADADARGNISARMEPTFTELADSNGEPYLEYFNFNLTPGSNLLELLGKQAEASGLEWEVDPDLIRPWVRHNPGQHRENEVRFHISHDQLQASRAISRRDIGNVIYTVAKNEKVPQVRDTTSETKWGRREIVVETANAEDELTAQRWGKIILDKSSSPISTATVQVRSSEGKVPFTDYDVGDWIYLSSDDLGINGSYRIFAIGLEVNEDGKETIELTVESALNLLLKRLQKTFERVSGSTLRVNSDLQLTSATSGSGSADIQEFSSSSVDLGTLAPSIGYTWSSLSGQPRRGLVTRFIVDSGGSMNWNIRVTSQPGGAGELMFEALGIGATQYSCSWPWWWKNQAEPQAEEMYVGIQNLEGGASHFTIVEMRGEKFE